MTLPILSKCLHSTLGTRGGKAGRLGSLLERFIVKQLAKIVEDERLIIE